MNGDEDMKDPVRAPVIPSSLDKAKNVATTLAVDFLRESDSKEFVGKVVNVRPDPINAEKIRKVPRYWIAIVTWSKNGVDLDGPAVICIDLSKQQCKWE